MKLALLATCSAGDCPSVYVDEDVADGSALVVQGYPVARESAGTAIPDGESLVTIPRSVLLEAAARLLPPG